MNKYLALKGEDKFDIDKITVVGSPTITSDGVASGFSSSNYIGLPNSITLGKGKSWDVQWQGKIPTVTTGNFITNSFTVGRLNTFGSISALLYLYNPDTQSYANLQIGLNELGSDFVGKAYKASIKYDGVSSYTFTIKLENGTERTASAMSSSYFNQIALRLGGGTLDTTFDLTAFKIYVDGQLVFQPVKPTYLLERRKPTVWNKGQFTVVGNPSISDDGWASGFTQSSYIHFNTIDISTVNSWEFGFEITTGNDITVNQYYLSPKEVYKGFLVGVENSKLKLLLGTTGTSWNIHNGALFSVSQNTKYYIRVGFTGNNYYFKYSTDNKNWQTALSVTSSEKVLSNSLWTIGIVYFNHTQYTRGSINLKQFKIYTDNNLVFDGGADTYVYDPSKFTVVGTPTITEYGVASGFSDTEDYVTPNKTISIGSTSWKIKARFFPVENTATDRFQTIFTDTKLDSTIQLNISVNIKGTGLAVQIRNEDSTKDVLRVEDINERFSANIWHNLEVAYENQTLSCYVDDVLLHRNSINIDHRIFNNVQIIGTSLTTGLRGNYGSIDLPSFSITVDGKEVFTGAKENYYMLKR